jgi:hypothetical protein
MKRLFISIGFPVSSVLKPLTTIGESFDTEDTENTQKAKVLSSREVE